MKRLVEVFDSLFDLGPWVMSASARSPGIARLAVDAAEVGIEHAVSSAVLAVEQTTAAVSAEERAPQEMLVLGWPVARDGMCRECFLDLVEGVIVDQAVVTSSDADTAVFDDADVVDIREHLVD